MRGFQKILKNNLFGKIVLLFLLDILIFSCRTAKEVEKKEDVDRSLKEHILKYEDTFNPSEYDQDVQIVLEEEKREREIIEAAKVVAIAAQETISGFRVQVLFTPEIIQANQLRDELLKLLPEEWTYIVYDAPYYKVRVGNFIDRIEANQFVKKLISLGYNDAWVVPDKIIKNPPPRLPEIEIEPEKQLEPRR